MLLDPEAQLAQLGTINSWISSVFALNSNDPIYNTFRDKTTLGLEVASLVTGGYAVAKGVVAFHKLVKAPGKIAKISTKTIYGMENTLRIGNFKYIPTVTEKFA